MTILAGIVSHPHNSISETLQPDAFGFRALKPAIAMYPQFLEMLVNRLSSADHALCTNALQLINSLMRDAVADESEMEWPRFIKNLQKLGVVKAVYGLMQGTALQDLATPLLEFQALTKVLLRKWREAPVELEKSDHQQVMKGIYHASTPEQTAKNGGEEESSTSGNHGPEKWRRLGFQTESPAQWEFAEVGFLGMMDLMDYVRKNEDGFQKLLLEQLAEPPEQRCPIARASLSVTAILYEHFEIDKADLEDAKGYFTQDTRSGLDKAFKPLLLQWSKLHTSGLQAFLRLWKSTSAEVEDFAKIAELVRILVEAVVGSAPRIKDVKEIESELADFDCQRLRDLQMELLELRYEDTWGHHLQQVRDELNHEALQFIKEQRIRCLLEGSWFPNSAGYKSESGPVTKEDLEGSAPSSYRFARLSHNRRYLHYADFAIRGDYEPGLEDLPNKSMTPASAYLSSFQSPASLPLFPSNPLTFCPCTVDLSTVSSVVSNISTTPPSTATSSSTLKPPRHPSSTSAKITIHGYLPAAPSSSSSSQPQSQPPSQNHNNDNHNNHDNDHNHSRTPSKTSSRKESPLLTLHPEDTILASEWLDGLLMLLNQQPITAETNKLVGLVGSYGLKIRLLNVRFDDRGGGGGIEAPEVPSREGLDEDYFYDIAGG